MTIFGDYARYYDVLYQDKDYAGEADFVLSCLVRRQGEPRTLLDLGCGTGRHGLEMARRGVSVTGVDMSCPPPCWKWAVRRWPPRRICRPA